jgi:hypothetical protein
MAEVRLDEGKATSSSEAGNHRFGSRRHPSRVELVAIDAEKTRQWLRNVCCDFRIYIDNFISFV